MSDLQLLDSLNRGPLQHGLDLLPESMRSYKARGLILKIVLQESRGIYRDQLERNGRNTVLGPALGLAQFERGGACTGLLRHPVTRPHLLRLLEHFGIQATPDAFWRALPGNDTLAMAAARLNLLWLPAPLPALSDAQESHRQYIEAWQPGAWTRGSQHMREELEERWLKIHAEVNTYFHSLGWGTLALPDS